MAYNPPPPIDPALVYANPPSDTAFGSPITYGQVVQRHDEMKAHDVAEEQTTQRILAEMAEEGRDVREQHEKDLDRALLEMFENTLVQHINKGFDTEAASAHAPGQARAAQAHGYDANGSPVPDFPEFKDYPREGVWRPDVKPTNPKDAIGSKKLAMHLVPGTLTAYAALAFTEGALKYGKYNWRVAGVRASIYIDAIGRHLEKYKNGEDYDTRVNAEGEEEGTGVPHLASIIACCGIILDAALCGKLTDDRPPRAPVGKLIDELADATRHLQQLFAGHPAPHQHTIEDEDYQP